MIAYLKGEVLEIKEDGAVILCGGIGYEVNLAHSSALELTEGTETALYVAESISPYDGTVLYGFYIKKTKNFGIFSKPQFPTPAPKRLLNF